MSKKEFEDDVLQKVFRFNFMIDGKTDPIPLSLITGTEINTEIVHVIAKGRGTKERKEYNKLTELCLKLGIFDIQDVQNDNHKKLLEDLKSAGQIIDDGKNSIVIKAKLEADKNGFENIAVRSIKLVKSK